MKQFEIYIANLRLFGGSEAGTPIVILQNGITDNIDTVICAPITSKEVKGDIHIKVNTQDGKTVYIMAEHMRNVKIERIKDKIGELAEEERREVKNRIVELMK